MVWSFGLRRFDASLAFVYWGKWLIAYVAIRCYNFVHPRRFDLYDLDALGDPVKLGLIVPQLEKDLESPCSESHLKEAADEIWLYGVNAKSECLLARIARGSNQVAEAFICLKLANGHTYHLVENSGYQQPFEENCTSFSCGNLQMNYLSPMRRWRVFYCGMLKQVSEDGTEQEKIVFVKFVFLWKASSEVYDLTLDTNPKGFASALARSEGKTQFFPPLHKINETLNMYAQSGTMNGTVSIEDGSDYEMYLFGEKMRSIGKSRDLAGCKFTQLLGNVTQNGMSFHLGKASAPDLFNNMPFGFAVYPDAHLEAIKELDITIKPYGMQKVDRIFEATFNSDSGEKFHINGCIIGDPLVLYSGQGWSGSLEISLIGFIIGNKRGSGLIMTGEVYGAPPMKTNGTSPLPSLPETIPLTAKFSSEVSHFGEVSGGKGSSLGRLTKLSSVEKSFTVPNGLVVTTKAYAEFLSPEIEKSVKEIENVVYGNSKGDAKEACNKASEVVESSELPMKIRQNIMEDLKSLFGDKLNDKRFAVRSSATGEDTVSMSAAGQMDTFLGVQGIEEIFAAVKKCWASQFGYIAVEYKRRNGQILNSPMAVVIQEMVACEVSGVLFTCDPVNNNPSVITITANYGLGETVVSGSVEPDTVTLKRDSSGRLEFDSVVVGAKHQKIIMQESGGTVTEDIPEDSRSESCLSEEMGLRLGKLAIQIEKYYKSSRDIEWGVVNNDIYILQSRPVTNMTAETEFEIKHEFDGPVRCENEHFSVSNVGEVYPGASSPLGLEILPKFFSNTIKRNAKKHGHLDFSQRNYFSSGILSFYSHVMLTVVEMTTRYGVDTPESKAFQMSMFGRLLEEPELKKYANEKLEFSLPHPKQTLWMQLLNYWDLFFHDYNIEQVKQRLDSYHRNFMKFNTAMETFAAILKSCSDFDAAGAKHIVSSESSSNWNMRIFQILLDAQGRLDTNVYVDFARLLSISSDAESANVPQAMQEVAEQIGKDIGSEKFKSLSVEKAIECLENSTTLAGLKFREFLQKHGHRCVKEIDVSSITWRMNPKILVKLLQNLVGFTKVPKKTEDDYNKIFSELNVPLGFWSKLKLKFVMPNCRKAIRGREAGKSCTVKATNHWRHGFRRLAKQMVSEGRIPEEELLFFMPLDEIKDLLDTRSPSIISRANFRKKMNTILEDYKFPEMMKGLPKPINDSDESATKYEFVADLTMKGIPVSQGVTKGYARVAVTLEEASHLKPGEILITYCTDIGWSPYFPIISGVVTELGGLISHGAVVSREYGLPCVVGLQEATKKFQTGDYVLLDGKKGILQRLPKPEQ